MLPSIPSHIHSKTCSEFSYFPLNYPQLEGGCTSSPLPRLPPFSTLLPLAGRQPEAEEKMTSESLKNLAHQVVSPRLPSPGTDSTCICLPLLKDEQEENKERQCSSGMSDGAKDYFASLEENMALSPLSSSPLRSELLHLPMPIQFNLSSPALEAQEEDKKHGRRGRSLCMTANLFQLLSVQPEETFKQSQIGLLKKATQTSRAMSLSQLSECGRRKELASLNITRGKIKKSIHKRKSSGWSSGSDSLSDSPSRSKVRMRKIKNERRSSQFKSEKIRSELKESEAFDSMDQVSDLSAWNHHGEGRS